MGGEAHEVEPLRERAALEILEVAVVLAAHLLVQDLDAIEPHLRRAVDAVGDVDGLAFEVPERVGGDADAQVRCALARGIAAPEKIPKPEEESAKKKLAFRRDNLIL